MFWQFYGCRKCSVAIVTSLLSSAGSICESINRWTPRPFTIKSTNHKTLNRDIIDIGSSKIAVAKCIYFHSLLIATKPDKDVVPVNLPYKKIFLNPRTLISMTVGLFSAAKWAGLDPILEPELRKMVSIPSPSIYIIRLATTVTLSGSECIIIPGCLYYYYKQPGRWYLNLGPE